MKKKIAILAGDGIGPEVMKEAVKIIDYIKTRHKIKLEYQYADFGGAAIDRYNEPLPAGCWDICRNSDAILLGSVGGPKWDHLPATRRPEIGGLLELRKRLKLFANLRPITIYPYLSHLSPLSERILAQPVDLITVRELAGGIYFSQPKGMTDDEGYDTERYNRDEIRRIAKVAFETARLRRSKVTSVDKANVLYSSMVWRKVVTEMAAEYTDIEFNTMYVDNAAMQLILNPSQFDVILTTNMFGDILSDETAAIVGSLGLLPSISLGDRIHLFEPAGGSAPDIAGQGLANPVAQILSAALMFQYSFDRPDIGSAIHQAVAQTLGAGFFTRDLQAQDSISTSEMGDRILAALDKIEI